MGAVMPNWFGGVYVGLFTLGVGFGLVWVFAPDIRVWWRRRRLRSAVQREQDARDPVRLQHLAEQQAHAEAAQESERAATFCARYAADLIADGVDPKEAYREAMAIYTNEVV
jgi:uncharacterized iron-regulated membrane protein